MKIALVGTAPLSRDMAPFGDPEWLIWACSGANAQGALPKIDAFFELHALVDMTGNESRASALPLYAWLRTQEFPVYMQEKNACVPDALVFPRDAMLKKFGRNWFTSTVAWMFAYAICQIEASGHTENEIGLFGVDMAATSEHYTAQRAGCTRFIEIAESMGIKVIVPFESCLASPTPLYGYSEATRFGRRLNVTKYELQAKRADMVRRRDQMDREIAYFDGALEQINYMIRTWTDGEDAELRVADKARPPPPKTAIDMSRFEKVGSLLVPFGKSNGELHADAGE
jgi:hypothetical protein